MRHIGLGTTNPLTLTTGSVNFDQHFVIAAVAPRAITFDEGKTITQNILADIYSGAPAGFLRVMHAAGDSLHYEGGDTSSNHGFYFTDLTTVKKNATMFQLSAEGGNDGSVQAARSRATAGNARKTTYHGPYVFNLMIGTNDPTLDENQKWTSAKNVLNQANTSGVLTHVNVGELLACGTVGSVTTADTSRCAAHDAYNVVMRTGMSSGGDFFTANPAITCGILRYATSVSSSYEVSIQVLNPASGAPGFGTLVGATTPSDTTNASMNHYGDFLHPRSPITRPNGTQPILARLGMSEEVTQKLDAALWS